MIRIGSIEEQIKMPNYTVQLRRGTTAEHSSFTGAAGEITVNTSNSSIHVHEGLSLIHI